MIILSLVCSVPFLMIAPMLNGWRCSSSCSPSADSCCSPRCRSTSPLRRLIAPISAATVSSLMMGFAWGTGGLTVPLVGMMADRIGIERALVVMSAMPLVAALLAVSLPSA